MTTADVEKLRRVLVEDELADVVDDLDAAVEEVIVLNRTLRRTRDALRVALAHPDVLAWEVACLVGDLDDAIRDHDRFEDKS